LVLNKATEEKITQIRTAIKNALGEKADVKSKVQQTTLEIKDFNEVTTKEEVCDAFQDVVGEGHRLEMDVIKSIRKGFRGTQTAAVNLPTAMVKNVIEVNKLRIGWYAEYESSLLSATSVGSIGFCPETVKMRSIGRNAALCAAMMAIKWRSAH